MKIILIRYEQTTNSLFITTYEFVRTNKDMLCEFPWFYVILDKGHRIKKTQSGISRAIKSLQTDHRVLMSKSPI